MVVPLGWYPLISYPLYMVVVSQFLSTTLQRLKPTKCNFQFWKHGCHLLYKAGHLHAITLAFAGLKVWPLLQTKLGRDFQDLMFHIFAVEQLLQSVGDCKFGGSPTSKNCSMHQWSCHHEEYHKLCAGGLLRCSTAKTRILHFLHQSFEVIMAPCFCWCFLWCWFGNGYIQLIQSSITHCWLGRSLGISFLLQGLILQRDWLAWCQSTLFWMSYSGAHQAWVGPPKVAVGPSQGTRVPFKYVCPLVVHSHAAVP